MVKKILLISVVLGLVALAFGQSRLVESTMQRASKPPKPRMVHIRGVVRDVNGQPMSGVTVTATETK